jgi:hypothetical protein
MGKILQNDYQLDDVLTKDQIKRALSGDFAGFKYFFENCMLLQDRDTRQYVHPKMNKGQEMIARTILGYVAKDTRATVHKECVILGPRQFGKSTLLTSISDYIEAYVAGMENLNIVHTLHTGDAAAKFFKQKIAPILTNVHPMIFPTIERDSSNSSTLLKYRDVKGIRRGGFYEVLSAGSNSVRSGTVTVWLCDEPSEYRSPEAVEDAISGAVPDHGFSFTAYIGTFSDRLSSYFLNKIQTALDNPDEMELVFIPWFLVYGQEGDGVGLTTDNYTEYDKTVIIPEMQKYGIPESEWHDKIGWYHRRALRTSKMKYEFPTSVKDILLLTADRAVFSKESLDKQEENILAGKNYRILTDNQTKKVEAQETDISPLTIYKKPLYGHKYRISIDPITARSDDSDNFAMHVMDLSNHEQVARFKENGLTDEEYADWAVAMGTIYNNADLCPEINVANGFVVAVNARRYYRWFYQDMKSRADRIPGIRTTVGSKEVMLDRLGSMLDRGTIIIHDEDTLDELRNMIKKIKTRTDGSKTIKMLAKKGHHDDLVAALWIYAGSLDLAQIEGRTRSNWAIL